MKDLILEEGEWNMVEKIVKARGPPSGSFSVLIEGKKGHGKSTYAIKTAVRVLKITYGLTSEEAWEHVKSFIVWTPVQFARKVTEIANTIKVAPVLIWDDAGYWLSAYKFRQDAVQSVSEYFDLARTHLNCVLLTTPRASNVTRRIRVDPGAMKVRIVKVSQDNPWKRWAHIYRWWESPDEKKTGTSHKMTDEFTCRLPDGFFAWYDPLRASYEEAARKVFAKVWGKILDEQGMEDNPNLWQTPIQLGASKA